MRYPVALLIGLCALVAACAEDSPAPGPGSSSAAPAAAPTGVPAAEAAPATVAADWQPVSALEGRLTLEMPGDPVVQETTVQTGIGAVAFRSHKVLRPGVVWNLLLVTYPEEAVNIYADPGANLRRMAEGAERQKAGSRRERLEELEGTPYPAIGHRFTYPAGTNAEGQRYAAGFSIFRNYAVGTTVAQVFVDVGDAAYKADRARIDRDLERFFGSVMLKAQEEPPPD